MATTVQAALALIDDADRLTRRLLVDGYNVDAEPMARTWGEVVQTAAELAELLPSPATSSSTDPFALTVQRLDALTQQWHRSPAARRWPGAGPTDEHLVDIADTLAEAAARLTEASRLAAGDRPVLTEAQLAQARHRVLHLLYVGAHAVHGTVDRHVVVRMRGGREGRRQDDRSDPAAARVARQCLADFEALVAPAVTSRRWRGGSSAPGVEGQVLAAAAAWDVQAQRVVLADPSPGTVAAVCRTQAVLARWTLELCEAGVSAGAVDGWSVQHRLAGPAQGSEQAWTAAATRWEELDLRGVRWGAPELRDARRELLSAMTTVTSAVAAGGDPPPVDVRLLLPGLQMAGAASHDLAWLVRAKAANDRWPAPAGHYSGLASIRAEPGTDVAQIDDGVVRPPHVAARVAIPLPDVLRKPLVVACDQVQHCSRTFSAALVGVEAVPVTAPAAASSPSPSAAVPGMQPRLQHPHPGPAAAAASPEIGVPR